MAGGNALGIIELSSIYKGYEVLDAVLKTANVEKLIARQICSGKYFIAVRGSLADVDAGLEAAREKGGFAIVNLTSLPNVDPKIFPAISGTALIENTNGRGIGAILIIETFSVVSAIKAADYAVKEADVDILRLHIAMAAGGKGISVMTGDIAALEAAVKPALEYIKQDGMLAGYAIIKNPHEDVLNDLI